MCAIFGVLDYKGKLNAAQRLQMVRALGTAAEIRGTDATGIAFFQRDRLCIQKAPKAAHKMKYRIPAEVKYIMGHTRMTTQGNPKRNQNNHPFPGKAGDRSFALAHNGVLTNDRELRRGYNLPSTSIETDSYVAVQLIEQEREVSSDSIGKMAERLEGHFTFTILDDQNNLYFVKGNNPLTIFHFKKMGLYLYASTEEILVLALDALGMESWKYQVIQPQQGEILKIDCQGKRSTTTFKTDKLDWLWPPLWRRAFGVRSCGLDQSAEQDEYIQNLKAVATFYGYDDSCVDRLLVRGFSMDDIEAFICCRRDLFCEG